MADDAEIWLDPRDYTRPHSEQVTVTPELAEQWLALNTRNRPLRQKIVAKHSATMRRGRWPFNGETLKLSHSIPDEEGGDDKCLVIDGQHRLAACVEAQKPFETLVVFGLPPEAQETVDIGAKRLFSDNLKLRGEVNVTILAATLRLFWMYENGHLRSENTEPAPDQLEHLLDEFPQIRNSVAVASPVTKFRTSPSVAATAHLLFSALDKDKANEFFDYLITGVGFSSRRHPIYTLREWIQSRTKDGNATKRFNREYMLVMYVKTWNHFVQGNEPGKQFLRWRTSGDRAEAFPILLDPNDP